MPVLLQQPVWPESEKLLPILNDADEDEQRLPLNLLTRIVARAIIHMKEK